MTVESFVQIVWTVFYKIEKSRKVAVFWPFWANFNNNNNSNNNNNNKNNKGFRTKSRGVLIPSLCCSVQVAIGKLIFTSLQFVHSHKSLQVHRSFSQKTCFKELSIEMTEFRFVVLVK